MFLVLYNFLIKTQILDKTYLTFVSFHLDFRSMLARDLQSIILYDQQGKFVGVRRPNSKLPIEIDGVKIIISDAIGSTGLDLKVMTEFLIIKPHFNIFLFHLVKLKLLVIQTDPGVPVVYAGFGALMLTTCISFLSHTQVSFFFPDRFQCGIYHSLRTNNPC